MSSDRPPSRSEPTETLVKGRRAAREAPLGAIIRALDVPSAPARLHLRAGVCTVGAAEDCDLVVRDPTVSRQHVELELRPEGVAVRDLASRNGTYYLGQRVERMVLALGSRMTLGRATIVIDPDTADLDREGDYNGTSYGSLIGATHTMRRLFSLLSRLEGTLVSVLIDGESGVGKELVARAIHERSKVASGPFVEVNCGAIPRELAASELFGHRRGAFTGAEDARKGAFELANGGTLFLDEVGELPVDLQPMLLRALESSEIQPVGAESRVKVRVRVVAATNRDLASEIAAGRFREDLFYRLAVVRLTVPALRERLEDVALLANAFAADHQIGPLPPAVVEALVARPWPGNVRELRNVVAVYAALGVLPPTVEFRTERLDAALEGALDLAVPFLDLKDGLVDRFTGLYLKALMASANGNQSEAARTAGLDRTYLRRLLIKHGLLRGR